MKRLLIVIIFSSTLFTCTQEEITSRQYPRVRTNSVTNITSGGALFNGEIYYAPNQIVDHGFIWSTRKTLTIENSERISLGNSEGLGAFGILAERSLAEGEKYYVKAYAQSKSHIVYGDVVEFISLGSNGPVLSSIEPKIGTWGDTVILVGLNFSSIVSTNTVKFAEQTAQIIYASEDTIKSIIPVQLNKSIANVSVSFDGNISELVNAFELKPPVINLISPTEGASKISVEISGDYFNPVNTKVFFGTKEAKINALNKTKIICEVPIGLSFGNTPVRVQTGEGQLFATTSFFVQSPKINSITPSSAPIYDTISIAGDYFGPDILSNNVLFDGSPAEILSASKTAIKVIVPMLVRSIKPIISITYNGLSVETDSFFTIPSPEILEIEPNPIVSNAEFMIRGLSFNPTWNNRVYLGSSQLNTQYINTTELSAIAPVYLYNHIIPLTVKWLDNETNIINVKTKWIRKQDSPSHFYFSKVMTYNDKAYIGFEAPSSGNPNNSIWEYNPSTDSWLEYTNFPGGPRETVVGFEIGSKAYIGNGFSNQFPGTNFNDFWSFDFETKTWTKLNDSPFSGSCYGFSIGGKGFVFENVDSNEAKLWRYNSINDSWLMESNLDFNIYIERGFEISNLYYAIDVNSILRSFNASTSQWEELGEIPSNTFQDASFAFSIGGFGYVGWSNGAFWKYNPNLNEWAEEINYMGEGKGFGIGFSINEKGYVISGSTESKISLEFDPSY